MHFSSHRPAPPLATFVDNLWHCSDAPTHSRERILPSGSIELVINLHDDEVRIYDPQQLDNYTRFPGIVVSGPYARAFAIDPSQHASMMGVHFKPGGAFAFFGTAVRQLGSNHVPLEALWGAGAVELRERLCSANSLGKRFHVLENTLNSHLCLLASNQVVARALRIFGAASQASSIKSVAEQLGLSQRRFIQVFSDQVGMTPKLFCRVMRFQRTREIIEQPTPPSWTQLALSCGYYDQSHLIHDFKEFAGLNPTSYFQLRSDRLLRNHLQFPS